MMTCPTCGKAMEPTGETRHSDGSVTTRYYCVNPDCKDRMIVREETRK